jgi:glycosyltransferase involved in cell wall biosynthesis
LYIRNADNLHFSYARNQAMPEATGKWVLIVDNDIIYRDHWLELGIKVINSFPDKKLIYSPINYPYVHKRDPRWRHGQLEVKGRHFNLTERAGSNCMLMKRETFLEMGKFELHRKSGCLYTDKLVNAGYLTITPAINWAFDAGHRRGVNFNKELLIDRTLTNGKNIRFN